MYAPGLEIWWKTVWELAEGVYELETDFHKEFPQFRQLLSDRMFFVRHKQYPVATASAWVSFRPEYKGWGQVHSVAVIEGHQGNGLGKYLTILCINKLIERGHKDIYVETTQNRPKAIQLYESLGFTRRAD
jgi:ribosomal protein S18 acetylase RimI-like enzyme